MYHSLLSKLWAWFADLPAFLSLRNDILSFKYQYLCRDCTGSIPEHSRSWTVLQPVGVAGPVSGSSVVPRYVCVWPAEFCFNYTILLVGGKRGNSHFFEQTLCNRVSPPHIEPDLWMFPPLLIYLLVSNMQQRCVLWVPKLWICAETPSCSMIIFANSPRSKSDASI